MAGKSKRPPLVLTSEGVQHLERLRRSRKAPAREVQRAEILWRYHGGETIAEIMRAVKITRKSVGKWIERALAMGVEAALKDAYHRPYEPRISEEAGLGETMGRHEEESHGPSARRLDMGPNARNASEMTRGAASSEDFQPLAFASVQPGNPYP